MTELEKQDVESDQEEYDSDGYNKKDPYRDQAKMVDKKQKLVDEYNSNMATKLSKSVLENKENITWFEKRIKTIIALTVLAFLVVTNLNKPLTGETRITISDFFDVRIITDSMREICMLVGSCTLFYGARAYNDYLERLEAELDEAAEKENREAAAQEAKEGAHADDTKKSQ